MFEKLGNDAIDALLTQPAPQVRERINLVCECGTRLNNGYCINPECPVDRDDREYFDCEWCGWCPDPNNCVWKYECPKCGAPASSLCRRQGGYEGLHAERWALVGNGC